MKKQSDFIEYGHVREDLTGVGQIVARRRSAAWNRSVEMQNSTAKLDEAWWLGFKFAMADNGIMRTTIPGEQLGYRTFAFWLRDRDRHGYHA